MTNALIRTAQWHAEEARKQRLELQRLVYGDRAAPPRSAAESLYPNHPSSSSRQSESARGDTAKPNTAARALYPNLK
jgi:hypothetical protein